MMYHVRRKYNRKNCDDTEEERANEVDLAKNLLDVIGSGSSLSDTGDCSAVLLEVVRNLYGIEGDRGVEIGETENKNEQKHRIDNSV